MGYSDPFDDYFNNSDMCSKCGSLVVNKRIHIDWHRSNNE